MFADVFAEARLREELQGKVRLLKERMCMTVQVYGSMKYILNIDIQIVQMWMEEKVTSKLNLDWKSRGCPRKLHENSGLGLRFQLLILATQSRVV